MCRKGRSPATLLHIQDVPEYLKVNPKILDGYRREMSWQKAVQTIFMLHNETLNIWSHLLGAICFVYFVFEVNGSQPSRSPKWPLLIFDIAGTYTLSISTAFHTCLCISRSQFQFWRKMDFFGILVTMYSMYFPFCYYCLGFNQWYKFYISIAGLVASMCLYVVLSPTLQSIKFHAVRPFVFGAMILLGTMPVSHAALLKQEVDAIYIAIGTTLTTFALVILGGVLYATRWPERVVKNTEKLSSRGFHSHFLFHICTLAGLYVLGMW